MLRFTKLRLSGFKSFVDPTELLIDQGLTGIVGPNGCGKSNLVEALRWVMGETSAKQMRGEDMDDVIFGGTSNRPARNIAEVVLGLDNSARVAPAAINDADELEVSRKIERQKGSLYRINGKEVRARDVQLLFADAATGARSTALVSQGRISAVITAKPEQRRTLLEEAAGISGLHTRRHEAELRLRGAEQNLERLEDILKTLDVQMESLRKQARQATRYRNLSDLVRKAEAMLYHLRWVAALDGLDGARDRFRAAQERVSELAALVAAASAKQAENATGLPDLRRAETEAAAALQRLVLEREALDGEERRIADRQRTAQERLRQADADSEREKALAADAGSAMGRLQEEQAAIAAARQGEEAEQGRATEALRAAEAAVKELEAQVARLSDGIAAGEAQGDALARARAEAADRTARLAARAEDVARQKAALEAESGILAEVAAAEAVLAEAQRAQEAAQAKVPEAEAARVRAGERRTDAEADLHEAKGGITRLKTEEKTLAGLLEAGEATLWPNLIDALTVEPGWETALGAALGEDLDAPADEAAPIHWKTLAPDPAAPALPTGSRPLSDLVKAPPALARRLAQIGVVETSAEGARLVPELKQGQRLVAKDGAFWRWDGYTLATGAPTPAAIRLEQRNRLREVRARLAAAEAAVLAAEQAAQAARAASEAAALAERETRDTARQADAAFGRARDALSVLKEKAARQSSRLQAVMEQAAAVEADLNEARRRQTEAESALADLPDTASARRELEAARAVLGEKRAFQVNCQAAHTALLREAEARRRRLDAVGHELKSWQERSSGAAERLAHLAERRGAVAAELDALSGQPAEIAARRRVLLEAIATAEGTRRQAADTLAAAETLLAGVDRDLRTAEGELARAREEMVRAEGAVEQGKLTCKSIAERIAERLECTPEEVPAVAGIQENESLPDLEAVEKRLERLVRERDTMGPVNLRAEHEMQELETQISTLTVEREDLVQAIAKLRQGIAELNREGRDRLLASFRQVDGHFQELFVRLFGGGRAHLTLTESDDPLEAGLEIMASPPGKRLQVLSLLSGGEQALTALALLFAVFLTNPAPICVLDEVDAPLDDANVDRVCSMLEEMSRSGRTRFLVITHHRMTMARMDRLFGVTMGERGVSQLVSVDLRQAERIRDLA